MKTNPSMIYHGSAWGIYSNDTTNEIWLVSPIHALSGSNTFPPYVQSYSITNNSFQPESEIPQSCPCWGAHCAVAVGNTLYYNTRNFQLSSYNILTKSWTADISPLPYLVQDAMTASDGRYICIIGGRSSTSAPMQYFQIYDLHNAIWLNNYNGIQPSNLSVPVWAAATEYYNGSIYIFGGRDGSSNYNIIQSIYIGFNDDVYHYTNTSKWTILSAVLTQTRYGIRSAMCNHINQQYIYLVGGYDVITYEYSIGDIVEIFNTKTNTITVGPKLNHVRYAPAVSCVNEYLYVMGGEWYNTATSRVETLDSWEISNAFYTASPTIIPTANPSIAPTNIATTKPSTSPTVNPSNYPSLNPTQSPTLNPSINPSNTPSVQHSNNPTYGPSKSPVISIPTPTPTDNDGEAVVTTENREISTDNGNEANEIVSSSNNYMLIVIIVGCLLCLCVIFAVFVATWKHKQRKQRNIKNKIVVPPQSPSVFSTSIFNGNVFITDRNKSGFHDNLSSVAIGNNLLMDDIVDEMTDQQTEYAIVTAGGSNTNTDNLGETNGVITKIQSNEYNDVDEIEMADIGATMAGNGEQNNDFNDNHQTKGYHNEFEENVNINPDEFIIGDDDVGIQNEYLTKGGDLNI
eukprot:33827_1